MASNLWQLWANLWKPLFNPNPPGYPRSFVTLPPDDRLQRAEVFDPALQHYGRGFRLGDPTFRDADVGRRWFLARQHVMDHLVEVIGASTWKDSLVLRGSYLLQRWMGNAAREPGDLDFVIRPANPNWTKLTDWGVLNGLNDLIHQRSRVVESEIKITSIVQDEIWSYDRVPGQRMVLTWEAEDLPLGTAQMDFVLSKDEMWTEPVETMLVLPNGRSARLWAATPELSLAWKLLWLHTDMHPQGKDLYDATLLAETCTLSGELLERTVKEVVEQNGVWEINSVFLEAGRPVMNVRQTSTGTWESYETGRTSLDFDWVNFQRDYPYVRGSQEEWLKRLVTAIEPSIMAHAAGKARESSP